MQVITIESEAYNKLMHQIEEIKAKVFEEKQQKPLSEIWLDNQDVCQTLNISKRTLQTYRDTGKLSYSQIGSKIYYKAADVNDLLNTHYITIKKK